MAWIGPVVGALIGAAGSYAGQESANSANANLNRENRGFNKMMADTAVRRRMADLKAAGLNPALAAGGSGADVPVTQAPHMESTTEGASQLLSQGISQGIQAQQAKANIALTNANTAKALAEAKSADVDAWIKTTLAPQERTFTLNKYVEGVDQTDEATRQARLKTIIMKNTADLTASQVEQFKAMMPNLIKTAQQQARTGEINLDALEKIANVGGVTGGKALELARSVLLLMQGK